MKKIIWKVMITLLVCIAAVGGNWSGYKVQAEEYTDDKTGLKYDMVDNEIDITGYTGTPVEIIIPDKINDLPVTRIERAAFYRCTSLTKITFQSGSRLKSIGENAFSHCSGLMDIEIPNSVRNIGKYAFYRCTSLTKITFQSSSRLESIGENAFSYCSELTSIEIPASVWSIGDYAFDYCSSLAEIKVAQENKKYTSQDALGKEYNAIMTIDRKELLRGCSKETIILNGVTSIGDSAFCSCRELTNITITDSVESIG